ncbi:MAG: exodeoxyribonuclease V subunit beta [Methylohalobius sp. ZOD2]
MDKLDLYGAGFDPGVHLIEASAGTGKTYSIAQLVARFAVAEGVPVEAMLVVTFTKAATAELRQRIQQRLIQVRDALRARLAEENPVSDDAALAEWIESLEEPESRLKRLEGELLKLDLMSIQTIHSFCQHALRQQALEAGELLGQTLLEDDRQFNQQIIDDFWRRQAEEMPPRLWRRILAKTPTPDALYGALKHWKPPIRFVPEVGATGRSPLLTQDEPSPFDEEEWQGFARWMDGLCEQKQLKAKARQWWDDIREEVGATGRSPLLKSDLIGFLDDEVIKKVGGLENLPDYAEHRSQLEKMAELGSRQAHMEIGWLQSAWRAWQAEYEHRLREKGWLTHDWMIRRLAEILREGGNAAVVHALRERFRLVLIDEFQDTDRYQWQIFSNLFHTDEHRMFLIGDPKQSIYRFRGADLRTYFQARGEARKTWQLGTNYRSHPDLVAAVNAVFAESGEDDRDDHAPFYDRQLGYHPVAAGRRADNLCLRRRERVVAPLQWSAFQEAGQPYRYRNLKEATGRLAEHLAGDVVDLLDEREGFELLKDNKSRKLRPVDLAVLVRDNDTALRVRDALRDRNVPAVLIDRRSVYQTPTAEHLYWLLMAFWETGDWRRIKRVIGGCDWFGLDARALLALEKDNARAGDYLEAFVAAGITWRRDSLLAAVAELFRRFGVWRRIAGRRYGQRTLADLRHLLEMLQETAVRQHLTPQALLSWYRRQLDTPPGEAEQLRLESDDESVEIVTMHSAKGLEYPVVFCFDLWRPEGADKTTDPVLCSTEEGTMTVWQAAGPEAFEAARAARKKELRQENLRIAYVALTRAKAHCRVYLVEKNPPKKEDAEPAWSPLFHLLSGQREAGDLFQGAEGLANRFPDNFQYQLREWRRGSTRTLPRAFGNETLRQPPTFPRNLKAESRVMTSYSALVRGQPDESSHTWLERLFEESEGGTDELLPRGAAFGNLLHELLEKIPFSGLLAGGIEEDFWRQALRRNGLTEDLVWEQVSPLLQNTLTTPLPDFSLAQVSAERQLKELEFFLPVDRLSSAQLNRRLKRDPLFRPLHFQSIQGFLHGFIDLVVEHGGRYYVLDYKSNELADYGPDGLEQAMRAHDYGLQALFYTLAMHRYLKSRRPGYDYAEHFGGVRYLFLRGMDGKTPLRGVCAWQPEAALIHWLDETLQDHDRQ